MKKLIVVALLVSFTGAVIAQQAPAQAPASQAKPDQKDKKKNPHHHRRHEHKPTDNKK